MKLLIKVLLKKHPNRLLTVQMKNLLMYHLFKLLMEEVEIKETKQISALFQKLHMVKLYAQLLTT